MYHAYLGVTSDAPDQRANAIELLELVLKPGMKSALIPIAECASRKEIVEFGSSLFGLRIESETAGLNALLSGDDDWLRTTALYIRWFKEPDSESHDDAAFESHENMIVRETAVRVRRSIIPSTVSET